MRFVYTVFCVHCLLVPSAVARWLNVSERNCSSPEATGLMETLVSRSEVDCASLCFNTIDCCHGQYNIAGKQCGIFNRSYESSTPSNSQRCALLNSLEADRWACKRCRHYNITLNNKVYELKSAQWYTHTQAKAACALDGAALGEITTADLFDYLTTLLRTSGQPGLTDASYAKATTEYANAWVGATQGANPSNIYSKWTWDRSGGPVNFSIIPGMSNYRMNALSQTTFKVYAEKYKSNGALFRRGYNDRSQEEKSPALCECLQ